MFNFLIAQVQNIGSYKVAWLHADKGKL
jgi:hypothetical protein